MARTRHRSTMRRSLPLLLAALLAFVVAVQGMQPAADSVVTSASGPIAAGSMATSHVATTEHSHRSASAPAVATVEPQAVPAEIISPAPLAGARERVLRTQLVTQVCAARAPPAASL